MIEQLAQSLVYDVIGVGRGTHVGAALEFFLYDTTKILLLLLLVTHLMGLVNSYFPVERIRSFLSARRLYGVEHTLAALFGAATPFCSCSSIPLFLGMLKGGVPLGVTFSFLITSPLVNEVAVAMFLAAFGWKMTLVYVASGVGLGTVLGMIFGRMRLERYLEPWVIETLAARSLAVSAAGTAPTWSERLRGVSREARTIVRGVVLYVLLGVGAGAAIHGFVPAGFLEEYLRGSRLYSVPLAVLVGVPLYSNAAAIVPVMQTLVAKGVPMGTALAFMMATVGLSFPEGMMLKRAMQPRLLALFFGSVAGSIIMLGYLFNALFAAAA